jgi:hypothetical protein
VAKNRTIVSDIDLPALEQVPAKIESAIPQIESDTETALPVIED